MVSVSLSNKIWSIYGQTAWCNWSNRVKIKQQGGGGGRAEPLPEHRVVRHRRPHLVKILVKPRSNKGASLHIKRWSTPVKPRSQTGQTLVKRRSNGGRGLGYQAAGLVGGDGEGAEVELLGHVPLELLQVPRRLRAATQPYHGSVSG